MISVDNLCKYYYTDAREEGVIRAVDALSFQVGSGEVLGFLGPNGAGKSTTMRLLTGFLQPTMGKVTVFGCDMDQSPIEAKKQIGYLPEGAPAYGYMPVDGFLYFVGKVRGLSGSQLDQQLNKVIGLLNLEQVRKQKIETLSKGFKRRVGLAQALIHDPKVLILDEPTDGLDPNQKHEVRKLIKQLAKDKIIIISTHILEEVPAVCNRVMVIASGKIKADETPDQFAARANGDWDKAFADLTLTSGQSDTKHISDSEVSNEAQ